MTVGDLLKQLENEDKGKIVIFRDIRNCWCNFKKIVESTNSCIVLIEDTDCPFSDEKGGADMRGSGEDG